MKNLFTYFLIFITYTLNAQPPQGFSGPPPAIGRITGKILDAAKNTPLEYSSVTIQNLRDSSKIFGALVDEELAHVILDETNMLGGFSAQKAGPRINTIFAKFAPDLGTNHVLQWGLSYAQAKQYQQLLNEDETTQSGDELALNGKQTLMGTDIVYKWDSAGQYGQGDFKIIVEYLKLKKDMNVVASGVGMDTDGDTVLDSFPLAIGSKVTGTQDGYTLQASYGIAPRWQVSLRHDATGNTNELNEAGNKISFKDSSRNSIAISFYASEFSRLRLQASQADLADETGKVEKVNQVFLQYTHSLGQHGAHKF